jgi:excisionase family DNA binding protein
MGDEVLAALNEPTVDLLVAGRILGIGRSATYRARKQGQIPAVRVGRQFRVPSSKLREMLGLPPQPLAQGAAPIAA